VLAYFFLQDEYLGAKRLKLTDQESTSDSSEAGMTLKKRPNEMLEEENNNPCGKLKDFVFLLSER